jgi:hypothetical protein
LSVRQIKEVLRLRFGLGLRQDHIARSCSIAQSSVHRYLERAAAAALSWPLPDEYDDARLNELLFPSEPQAASPKPPRVPDFAEIHQQDPTRPAKGWRTAWRKLTKEAGLEGLRGHDLRHNWITSHAEIGTPLSVLEAQAGHLSKRMSDRYKHISEKAARKASDELSRIKAKQRADVRAALQTRADGLNPPDKPSANQVNHGAPLTVQ